MDNLGFVDRFKELLDENNISASTLADEIDVQRSSISHILSGRNKPSLDFVLKLLKRFPEINIYWLLNGTESKLNKAPTGLLDNNNTNEEKIISSDSQKKLPLKSKPDKNLTKIVLFYDDGSFEQFLPD